MDTPDMNWRILWSSGLFDFKLILLDLTNINHVTYLS